MAATDSILAALAPVFALILIGHVMARCGFPGAGFWAPAERLTYYVFFPALLVANLARASLGATALGPLALVLAGAILTVTLAMLAARRWLPVDGPGFSSLVQGAIRFNTYVGLAAAFAMLGEAGLTLAAVAIAVLVPLVNVICVGVLGRYGSSPQRGRTLLRSLLTNPLILACAGGIALNVSGLGLPWGSGAVLDILGGAALPLGLLAVGAGLNVAAIRGRHGVIVLTAAIKLVGLPLLTAGGAALLGLPAAETTVAVLFAALPGASSSYILARQMGGDAQLMAGLLTVQTVVAVLTLPLMLAWLT